MISLFVRVVSERRATLLDELWQRGLGNLVLHSAFFECFVLE